MDGPRWDNTADGAGRRAGDDPATGGERQLRPAGHGPTVRGEGFVVGPYRAITRLGAGATAATWSGVDERDGRPVALKVFAPGGLEAARREATLAQVIDHPHLPAVLEVVADPSRPTLVTELATGGTLAALLDRVGTLSVGQTVTVLLPLASLLATAHERQVAHGDVSTHNVVLDAAGRPLLIDLGAAHAAQESDVSVSLTPCHAAPEVAGGGAPGPAGDVFALGSLARECLTGVPAWPATELADVVRFAGAGGWPDVPDTIGSAPLAALVRAMLRPDPVRRPGAASLVVGLRAVGRPEPLPMPLPDGSVPIGPGPGPGLGVDLGVDDDRHVGAGVEVGVDVHDGPGRGRMVRRGGADGEGGSARPPRSAASSRDRLRLLGEAPFAADDAQALTRARTTGPASAGAVPAGRRARRHSGSRSTGATRGTGSAGGGRPVPPRRRRVIVGLLVCVLAGLLGAGLLLRSGTGAPWVAASTERTSAETAPPAQNASAQNASAQNASAQDAPTESGPVDDPAGGDPAWGGSVDATAQATPGGPAPPGGASPATGGTAGAPGSEVDWLTVVRTLSADRGRALTQADPALLDLVYVPGPARQADLGTLEQLRGAGATVTGAAHEVVSAGVIGPVGPGTGHPTGSGLPGIRLLVTDRLPSYEVRDGDGTTVGRTASRDAAALVMTVVETEQGYRIEEVAPA